MTIVLTAWCGLGCCLVLLMLAVQRRALQSEPPMSGEPLPPVSILKPMRGIDPDLESNLDSFLRLDYPSYELILGIQDPADPAVQVARRFAAGAGLVPVRVVVGEHRVGFNPKVNNLAGMLPAARHDLLLVSDSNVAVRPDVLRSMVRHLQQPGVGMVTSLIRGVGGRGLGGVLEAVQLNTFVMGGVATASRVFGRVAAVGKSMLLHRADLERVGGLDNLGRYLAEDQVCGELLDVAGRRVMVAGPPVDNVLGDLTVRQFARRHLRWARIRRHVAPWGYAAELLANPVPPAALLLISEPGLVSASVAVGVMAVLVAAAVSAERRLGLRRPAWAYPVIELARGLLVATLWPVPFVSRTVAWHHNEFRIGRRTLLEPLGPAPDEGDEPLAREVTA